MADPLLSFRTITECFLVRYDLVSQVLTPTPIALTSNPDAAVLSPGFSVEDLKQTSCKGESQVILTYLNETIPELSLTFGSATPELEAVLLNRQAEAVTSKADGWVYFSAVANSTSIPAKTTGQFGYDVALQTAATSGALVYYIDPSTKLHQLLTVVDTAPSSQNEIQILANLELVLHADLAATGYNIYGYIPDVTFPNATIINSTSSLLYGCFLMGICFDNTVRQLTCGRMSWIPGGDFTKEPSREVKFRVLENIADSTGLGYDITYVPSEIAC